MLVSLYMLLLKVCLMLMVSSTSIDIRHCGGQEGILALCVNQQRCTEYRGYGLLVYHASRDRKILCKTEKGQDHLFINFRKESRYPSAKTKRQYIHSTPPVRGFRRPSTDPRESNPHEIYRAFPPISMMFTLLLILSTSAPAVG